MIDTGLGLTSAVELQHRDRHVLYFTAGSLPAGMALSRGSSGSYAGAAGQMQFAGPDEPRFEADPDTGMTGLLLEGSRTNLMPYSAVSTAGWYASGAVLTDLSLAALGAFGGMAVASAGQDWHRALRTVPVIAGTAYAIRLLWRPGSSGQVMLLLKDSSSSASTIAGGGAGAAVITSAAAGAAAILEDRLLGDGITRLLHVTWTPLSSGGHSFGCGPDSSAAGEDIEFLAMQLETGTEGSSYIATSGGAETRQADLLSATGLDGTYDIAVTFTDGSTSSLPGISVTPGGALPLPHGRLAQVEFIRSG